ncbi:MAG: YeiH family protein [Bacillaceae bacterium]
MKKKIKDILPGLLLCIGIAYLAKFLGTFIPSIGGASLAIFIGILAGNTVAKGDIFDKGSKFAESNLLSYSIVLLGGTLSFQTLLELGVSGLGFIILQMALTITGAIWIGKKLGFSQDFRYLMASGNAVCGSSAIAATAPAIGANDRDKSMAITIVNVTGVVLLFLLPFIAGIMYSFEELKTSALIGGVLQSVGQVVASGLLVDENVKELAMLFKIVRVIFLVIVVFTFVKMKHRNVSGEEKRKKVGIPWYIYGFFGLCLFKTLNIIPESFSHFFKIISNNFEIIALAGIGMRVKIADLKQQGLKVSLYALGIAAVQIVSALILIRILLS